MLCFFYLSLEFCSCGCFFVLGILNVFVVGDSELEEAAGSVLRFFSLSLEFCNCGCFFFGHSECICSWRFRTGGSSWECVVFFSLSLEFCNCGCFFFGILNVFAVGDPELEEAAVSI